MLKSMTGFGKSECQMPKKKLTIEIRSLNSKQIDTSTRLPAIYREKEIEIRQILSKSLIRGKVECTIHYEVIEGSGTVINKNTVRDYMNQVRELAEEFQISAENLFSTVMRLPDTISVERTVLGEEEWDIVQQGITQAVTELDQFRIQEGEALKKDITEGVEIIRMKLKQIAPYEKERIDKVRERIKTSLKELELEENFDENRFEQELIFYIERLDINEEKVRLANHLEYFFEILNEGSPNGKKLGFITQEMGREINTLGSKANHSEIQKLVMEMKDELEKVKEQLLNVL
jgi:uncharacterized protein (TIGR00255 family)